MKYVHPWQALVGLGLACVALAPVQAAPCGTVLTSDLTLMADMNCPDTALYVAASGITIDVNGYQIVVNGSLAPAIAPLAPGIYDDVTIRGPGIVVSQDVGILASGLRNSAVVGLSFIGVPQAIFGVDVDGLKVIRNRIWPAPGVNSISGIHLWGATHGALILANRVVGMSDAAIRLGVGGIAYENTVSENRLENNVYGVVVAGGTDSILTNNTIHGATIYGIVLGPTADYSKGSSNNLVQGNRIYDAQNGIVTYGDDINLVGTSYNEIRGNLLIGGTNGIYIAGAADTKNQIIDNVLDAYVTYIMDNGVDTGFFNNTCAGMPC